MNKLTKNTSSVILIVSMLSFVLPVMAQTTTTTVSSVTTATTTTINVSSSAEGKLQSARNGIMRVANRFDVHIRNLESLSSRIASRINKIEQSGKDTTQAKAKLNEANMKIQESKDALVKLQQDFETAITSASPKKNFAASKDKLVKGVMDKIKAAHKALVETVVILVKVSKPLETATSTTTTTTTTTIITTP